MLADIITRLLMMVLGYAYPAFECFKTVEKNTVQIEELRFWCQYWIIIALLTVCERVGDMFVSWVPMYSEMKLALFLYLWYPKTKGTGYVYETLLRPLVSKHETDIDKSLQELRTRAWDLAIYYYHNCTELGQTKFFQLIEYVASQSGRLMKSSSQKGENENKSKGTPPPPPNTFISFNQKQPPVPSAPPANLMVSKPGTQFVHSMEMSNREHTGSPASPKTSENGRDHNGHGSLFRFRRAKGSH